MATFKAVVLAHQKKADGTFNVKIRVTHKRKSKYIASSITAKKGDLTSKLEIKPNSSLMFRCVKEIEPMVDMVSKIGYQDLDDMTVEDLVAYLEKGGKSEKFKLDFFIFADEEVAKLSEGSAKVYTTALNSFAMFLGKRECDINSINGGLMSQFVDYLRITPSVSKGRKKKVSDASIKLYITKLSTIFRTAKEKFNDEDMGIIMIPRNPFKKINFGNISHKSQPSLTIEQMQSVISYDPSNLKMLTRKALDIFILSFALAGLNLADMYELKYPRKGELTYNRKKTRNRRTDKAEMRVCIPECVRPIIDRLADPEHKWLIDPKIKYKNAYIFSSNHSRRVKLWSESVMGMPFTMYSARRSFATLARNKFNVDIDLIDECLVHSPRSKMADIYIDKDWNRIAEVQEKVVSLFQWPEK